MKKRGQATIFIIIAIVIVAIIISLIVFKNSSTKENQGAEYFKSQGLQPSINNIQDFIIDCLETTSKDALIKIGLQGGYNNPPELSHDMEWNFIPMSAADPSTSTKWRWTSPKPTLLVPTPAGPGARKWKQWPGNTRTYM